MSTAQRFRFLFNEARTFYHTFCAGTWTRRSLNRFRDISGLRKFNRLRRDTYLRGALQCLRHVFDKPRRKFLMFSATAVCKTKDDDRKKCSEYISDEKLQNLLKELVEAHRLMKATIYCPVCHNRRVISEKLANIKYCTCKTPPPPPSHKESDGWIPFLEAKDVIMWRKQWKGEGQYAYKVYGKYDETLASDLAAVQLDLDYRKVWDNGVAALTMVEEHADGVKDQDIIYWEVMWPRLFANRDYVYVRRNTELAPPGSVGKQKSDDKDKLFVIVSNACQHSCCPENKNAIRVMEYWSQMVISSLHGVDKAGAEYVLTYYDEPGSGGMPAGVAAWATGRAVPDFLVKMRAATNNYKKWLQRHDAVPVAIPVEEPSAKIEDLPATKESGMESAKCGPIIDRKWLEACEQEKEQDPCRSRKPVPIPRKKIMPICTPIPRKPKTKRCTEDVKKGTQKSDGNCDASPTSQACGEPVDEGQDKQWNSWWRYLHPYYYFA